MCRKKSMQKCMTGGRAWPEDQKRTSRSSLICRPFVSTEYIHLVLEKMSSMANKFFVSCYDRGHRWFSNEAERFNQKFQKYKSSNCGGYSRIYPVIISPGVSSMLNNPLQDPNNRSFKRRATFRKEWCWLIEFLLS